jgi:5-formyltetrahydrofolate cyclo-ligase
VPDDPPPPPPHDAGKPVWRAWARARRRALALDAAAQAEADRRSLEHLLAWPRWRSARWALVYLPFGDEADPLGAMEAGTGAAPGTGAGTERPPGPRLATTRTSPGLPLTVHALDGEALERHPFGFSQPPADATPVPLDEIDVVLVPGLVFDRQGVRLGYGRGLYDRLLAPLPPTMATVGVTREALLVPRLPREGHDVAVRFLLTEAGLRAAAPSAR